MAVFYTLGVHLARQSGPELKRMLDTEEIEHVARGFKDSLLGKVEDERFLIQQFGPMINDILNDRAKHAVDFEKEMGARFIKDYLAGNSKAAQLPSGLVFHETLLGTGKQAKVEDTVVVHYEGSLTDGTIFDSSIQRNEPLEIPLSNVIPGWREAVALMRVGGTATVLIPSEIAYGDQGAPPTIPPGATLIFNLELIKVVDKA